MEQNVTGCGHGMAYQEQTTATSEDPTWQAGGAAISGACALIASFLQGGGGVSRSGFFAPVFP